MGWEHDPAYDTPAYRKARKACLAKATRCALAIPGICTGRPTQADHVVGLANDPEHKRLQAVCAPCHDVKTAAERRAALAGKPRRRAPQPIPRTAWGDEEPSPKRGRGGGPRLGSV